MARRRPDTSHRWRTGRWREPTAPWHTEPGNRSATVEHVVGLSYLAELVAKPDTDISAADLSAVVAGGGPIDRGQSGAPLIDERARDEYRRRPAHIASSRPPTAAATPTAAAERPSGRAAEEREALLEALRNATGRGGRARRMSDDSERSRMRVSKAIPGR